MNDMNDMKDRKDRKGMKDRKEMKEIKKTEKTKATNLIFFDVDGTLLEFSKGIKDLSLELKKALDEIHRNGDRYFICTGRSHGMLPSTIRNMAADGYSLCAGAFVTVNGQEIRNVYFSQEKLDFIMNRLTQYDPVLYLECGFELYSNLSQTEENNRYQKKFGINPIYVKPLKETKGLKVNKISVIFSSPEHVEAMEDFSDQGITVLPQPGELAFDITLAHSTKRDGIKAIKEFIDIAGDVRTIAFGDNYNDIEMIEYVDIGVAMGNGPEDLKTVADFVTRSVEEDGVLFGLKELGII